VTADGPVSPIGRLLIVLICENMSMAGPRHSFAGRDRE
jgi:hypothetical protein